MVKLEDSELEKVVGGLELKDRELIITALMLMQMDKGTSEEAKENIDKLLDRLGTKKIL